MVKTTARPSPLNIISLGEKNGFFLLYTGRAGKTAIFFCIFILSINKKTIHLKKLQTDFIIQQFALKKQLICTLILYWGLTFCIFVFFYKLIFFIVKQYKFIIPGIIQNRAGTFVKHIKIKTV